MTNEQREAIELLERIHASYFLSGMIEQTNYIVDKAYETDKAIDTVLSLIKEQQEEIEKKDKQIDLMVEHIHITGEYECPNIKCEDNGSITCEACIKQYFAELVEKE